MVFNDEGNPSLNWSYPPLLFDELHVTLTIPKSSDRQYNISGGVKPPHAILANSPAVFGSYTVTYYTKNEHTQSTSLSKTFNRSEFTKIKSFVYHS